MAQDNTKQDSDTPIQRSAQTLNSTDALSLIEHGGDITITITTPVGTSFRCNSQFIGCHTDNKILIEIPNIDDSDVKYFFQEGFWLTIRAISQRGEGGVVQFRSQLMHIIEEPIRLLALSVPQSMQVTNLRKEPRYDLNLGGQLEVGERRVQCELRDMSKSGCRFILPALGKSLDIGQPVAIHVQSSAGKSRFFPPLSGLICNLQKFNHYIAYGIKFDTPGERNGKALLAQLKFDGTKLKLRS
ncbi:flagellar brake domain-containing protein [Vibrio hippocampi]|uniref:Cyclic di-GMP binding protein n=1 Tax=Vibrio hippocampi TaxID=654686 RepID=A0ABM8ZNM7_9VIBR|nr:flagellar brake protein [Vibrio hippocampi]CAH0530237.1 Cyclic di-GMP binding protein [Vibrio hippocampi]